MFTRRDGPWQSGMSSDKPTIRVVIEPAFLQQSTEDSLLQPVATVYIEGEEEEYRVLAPPRAKGDPLDWVDQFRVRQASADTPGADVDVDPLLNALIKMAVKEELKNRKHPAMVVPPVVSGNPASMHYHVLLTVANESEREVKFDLPLAKLRESIVTPYGTGQPIVINGRVVPLQTLERVQIFRTPYPSSKFEQDWTKFLARAANPEWYFSERSVEDVTDEFIATTPMTAVTPQTDYVELLCYRFPKVALQLLERHDSRDTLEITDEYDVQDLFHALLRVFFDDVRPEAWTPSYAGKSSRMDFLLPVEKTVVEAKKTRAGLGAPQVGDQLIVDIARYREDPRCKRLICFVYDPENRIENPRGLERDLSRTHDGLEVKVIISSQR